MLAGSYHRLINTSQQLHDSIPLLLLGANSVSAAVVNNSLASWMRDGDFSAIALECPVVEDGPMKSFSLKVGAPYPKMHPQQLVIT